MNRLIKLKKMSMIIISMVTILVLTGCKKESELSIPISVAYTIPVHETAENVYLLVNYEYGSTSSSTTDKHILTYNKSSEMLNLYATLNSSDLNYIDTRMYYTTDFIAFPTELNNPYIIVNTNELYNINDNKYIDIDNECILSNELSNCKYLDDDMLVLAKHQDNSLTLEIKDFVTNEVLASKDVVNHDLVDDDTYGVKVYSKNTEYLGIVIIPTDREKKSVVLKYYYNEKTIEEVASDPDYAKFDFDLNEDQQYVVSCGFKNTVCTYDTELGKISEYDPEINGLLMKLSNNIWYERVYGNDYVSLTDDKTVYTLEFFAPLNSFTNMYGFVFGDSNIISITDGRVIHELSRSDSNWLLELLN